MHKNNHYLLCIILHKNQLSKCTKCTKVCSYFVHISFTNHLHIVHTLFIVQSYNVLDNKSRGSPQYRVKGFTSFGFCTQNIRLESYEAYPKTQRVDNVSQLTIKRGSQPYSEKERTSCQKRKTS